MRLAGTGHRPQKLGLNYSEKSNQLLKSFCIQELQRLSKEKIDVTRGISGGANGLDLAYAEACLELKIPFTLALPFKGFGSNWPKESWNRLGLLIEKAQDVIFVSYEPYISTLKQYKMRDQWMVDNSDGLLALYSGDAKSGTGMTVKMAQKAQKLIYNLWENWLKFRDSN